MKKAFMGLALAAMTFLMVACGDSPKSLAKEMAKAYENDDEKAAIEILQKVNKMSEEDQREFALELVKVCPDYADYIGY